MSATGLKARRFAERFLVSAAIPPRIDLDWITRKHRGVSGTLRRRAVTATAAYFIGPDGGPMEEGFALGLEPWPTGFLLGDGVVDCVSPDSKRELDQIVDGLRGDQAMRQVFYDSGLGGDGEDLPPLDDSYHLQAALGVPQMLLPRAANVPEENGDVERAISFLADGGHWHGITFPEILPAMESVSFEILGSVRAMLRNERLNQAARDQVDETDGDSAEPEGAQERNAVYCYLGWCEAVLPDIGAFGLFGVLPLREQARNAKDLVTIRMSDSEKIFEAVGLPKSALESVRRQLVRLEGYLDVVEILYTEPLAFIEAAPQPEMGALARRVWRRMRGRLVRDAASLGANDVCDLTVQHCKLLLTAVNPQRVEARVRQIASRLILVLVDADVITRSLPQDVRRGLIHRQKTWQEYVRAVLSELRGSESWRLSGNLADFESDAAEDYIAGQTRVVRGALENARALMLGGNVPVACFSVSESGMRSAIVTYARFLALRENARESERSSERDVSTISDDEAAAGLFSADAAPQVSPNVSPSPFLIALMEEGQLSLGLQVLFGDRVESALSTVKGTFDTEFILRRAYELGCEREKVVSFSEAITKSLSHRAAILKYYNAVRGYDEARISPDTLRKDAETWTKRIQRAAQGLPDALAGT